MDFINLKKLYNTRFFIIGMHFSHAVAIIQSLVGSIKGVQIMYSDKVWTYVFILKV